MDEASNSVSLLEGRSDGRTHFFDYAGVVAAYCGGRVDEANVLPICGIEGDGNGFDEDVVWTQRGDWDVVVD
jgi:hypothetical protein